MERAAWSTNASCAFDGHFGGDGDDDCQLTEKRWEPPPPPLLQMALAHALTRSTMRDVARALLSSASTAAVATDAAANNGRGWLGHRLPLM